MGLNIKFGTSGWRAVFADEFTLTNIKVITQAISNYIIEQGLASQGVIVGYDPRFLGERFAVESCKVLAANNIKAYLCNREVPTPVISHQIVKHSLAGGINFTASHNPPEYNGIKFSPNWGGPALPETTNRIEEIANSLLIEKRFQEIPLEKAKKEGLISDWEPAEEYLQDLKEKVDVEALKKGNLHLIIDPMYGAARGYLDTFLTRAGCRIEVLHNRRDPYFGGKRPEPVKENLEELISRVNSTGANLGLATDGDADRFGIIDSDGSFIEANAIIALLLDYLVRTRGWKGGVARSVATTHFIDAIARKHNLEVEETPVGFKFIGVLISQDRLILGGEESAGLSIKGHVPEKDGIIACLLTAEMVAREGKTIKELRERLFSQVGSFYTHRVNLDITNEIKGNLWKKLKVRPSFIDGLEVEEIKELSDGSKFVFKDGSWMLIRLSGTEPVVRCYGEAESPEKLAKIMEAGTRFVLE